MGKVSWQTAMSLDGFVAGPGDAMGWATDVEPGSSEAFAEHVASIGALLVGRRTQDVEDANQPGFYGGAYSGPFFVLRHDPPPEPPVVKGVEGRFVNAPIEEVVALGKEAAGDRDVVILGPTVARSAIEAGLLDEILVFVAPVLLGDGVRLFDRPGGEPVALTPTSVRQDGGLTALRFATTPA
jgi:dihydrofolate reductase